MLYVFWGPNDFTLREEVARLRASLGPADLASLNYSESEASALAPGELASLTQTMPFLGEKRLVVLRGLLAPFEPRQKSGPPEPDDASQEAGLSSSEKEERALTPLLEVLAHLPPSTDLVLIEARVSQRNKLLPRLPQDMVVREFPLPAGPELEQWIAKRAEGLGGVVQASAAHLLAEYIGPDLWTLDSELRKLLLYTAGRSVDEGEVRLLVSQVREASVFALVDAVMASRPGPALGLAHQLLEGGTSPSHLLVLLARQVRLLLQAKDLASQGLTPQALAGALGFRSPWAARKLARQAEGYSYPRLGAMYRRLVEEDLALKTSRHTPEVGLDLLVMEMCGSRLPLPRSSA